MNRRERELDKELRFHIDQYVEDLVARGADPAEAHREAMRLFGGVEQAKEKCRDERRARFLGDMAKDIRYALRGMRRNPGFAAVTLATLALAIGATTVMFTVVNGVLLRPLPYPDPGRLERIYGRSATWNVAVYGQQNMAYPDFLDLKRASRSLEIAGILYTAGSTMSRPGDPEHVDESEVSANLFALLRKPLFRGREFTASEDRPGGAPVAILGYSLWRRRFAADPRAIGETVVLEDKPYTVVGIAPAGFGIDDQEPDIYTPLGQNTFPYMSRRATHPVSAIARVREGFTVNEARAELRGFGEDLARQHPDTNQGRSFTVDAWHPAVGGVRDTLWLLLAAVGIVLLIACGNIASLLLARSFARGRELAMRMALGAGQMRLVRQRLTESSVLAMSGGALGVLLAGVGIRPFTALWPGDLPRAAEVHLDWRVLAFALAASIGSGLLFGIAPALRAPARNLEQALRAGARTTERGSQKLHGAFVITQIALAMVLLVAAATLGQTLARLASLDPGVDIRNVLVMRMALSPGVLDNAGRTRAAWDAVLAQARTVPGVEAVAAVDTVPMREGVNELAFSTNPAIRDDKEQPVALATSVTPDYLKVMRIALGKGRFFDDRDRMGTEPVIVIDDVMARQAFGEGDAIGRRLWIPDMSSGPVRVVGVVGHVRHWGLASDDQARVRAQLYYPFAQVPDGLVRRWSELMSVAVRTSVPPLSVLRPLSRAVQGAEGDQVAYEVRTMDQLAAATLARHRFLLALFGIFAGFAVLLASIGIYGVLAFLMSRRVPEIGLRVALGATRRDVMRDVLGNGFAMTLTGLAIGTAGALATAPLLRSSVDGVSAMNPMMLAATAGALAMAAFIASFLPAWRASRIDPMIALRQD